MLKKIWYQLVKIYITTALFFYHKKIKIVGTENIPKKGALLFVANHKNALIDPLLIATTTTRNIHFLTRASAFKIPLVKWILSTVNMLPIYRLRDGKETLAKNEEIFNICYSLFNNGRSLLIFPEGTHDIRRWVRPLSKGFTRIIFGALEQNPNLELTIVPVGLNYSKAEDFAESVSVIYGEPISVSPFYNKDKPAEATLQLKEAVGVAMKQLTTHISDIDNYDAIIQKLGNVNYLDPDTVNDKIKNLDALPTPFIHEKKPTLGWNILYGLVKLNSVIPVSIWKVIQPKIQEVEFESTTRFAIGATAFPLFYLLQTYLIHYLFTPTIALLYFVLSIILVLVVAKNKPN